MKIKKLLKKICKVLFIVFFPITVPIILILMAASVVITALSECFDKLFGT